MHLWTLSLGRFEPGAVGPGWSGLHGSGATVMVARFATCDVVAPTGVFKCVGVCTFVHIYCGCGANEGHSAWSALSWHPRTSHPAPPEGTGSMNPVASSSPTRGTWEVPGFCAVLIPRPGHHQLGSCLERRKIRPRKFARAGDRSFSVSSPTERPLGRTIRLGLVPSTPNLL